MEKGEKWLTVIDGVLGDCGRVANEEGLRG